MFLPPAETGKQETLLFLPPSDYYGGMANFTLLNHKQIGLNRDGDWILLFL